MADAKMLKKVPVREQDPKVRATNFEEVCLGYNQEEAMEEAQRCLGCKKPKCVEGCPVSINIPGFIEHIKEGNMEEAYKVIGLSSALPAICGRVCPQESQCEGQCIRGKKGEAVSIGKLERFVADYALEHDIKPVGAEVKNGHKVAVIGSGPSGLAAADQLNQRGHDVTVYERDDRVGGLLMYGIPNMKLEKQIIDRKINVMKEEGVKFITGCNVGVDVKSAELLKEYDRVILCCGAKHARDIKAAGRDAEGIYFDEKINGRLRGVSRMESLDIILERASRCYTQEEKEQLATRKNESYVRLLEKMSLRDLSDEVKNTLDTLRQRGYKLAIGSSSKNTKKILKQIGLDGYFDAVSDGTNITKSKPDPEVFIKAAEMVEEKPENCLVVEDALAGIDAAYAGGFISAGIGDAASHKYVTYPIHTFSDLLSIDKL